MTEYTYNNETEKFLEEIMGLVYQINCKTKFSVFMNYSGHTDQLDVRICKGKENNDFNEDASNKRTIYLSGHEELFEILGQLCELRDNLKNVLAEYAPEEKKIVL